MRQHGTPGLGFDLRVLDVMNKQFAAAACAALGLALAGYSQASATTFIFDTTDVPAFGGAGPFGQVDVTSSGTGLDFAVTLASGFSFRDASDANHWDLNFNLDQTGKTLTGLTPGVFFQAPGSGFKAAGFGTPSAAWNYAVDCTAGAAATGGKHPSPAVAGCYPGTNAANPTSMSFSIAGITLADLNSVSNGGKNVFFVADLVDGSGNTGNVGATLKVVPPPPPWTGGVPEPATWTMMILGLGGVGAMIRASRRRSLAADAVA
jgi:hypothetical protein